jgi:hypothetical protein
LQKSSKRRGIVGGRESGAPKITIDAD